MSEVFVSFAVRNNIAAVVVAKEGVLKVKQVERVKDAQALDNSYRLCMRSTSHYVW